MLGKILLVVMALCLPAAFASGAPAKEDFPQCAWKVTAVQAGKWPDGRKKDGLWLKGSFILPPMYNEIPQWEMNGFAFGESKMCATCGESMVFLPDSSRFLREGQGNTVTLRYIRTPCAGVTSSKTFSFKWSEVPNGRLQDL